MYVFMISDWSLQIHTDPVKQVSSVRCRHWAISVLLELRYGEKRRMHCRLFSLTLIVFAMGWSADDIHGTSVWILMIVFKKIICSYSGFCLMLILSAFRRAP